MCPDCGDVLVPDEPPAPVDTREHTIAAYDLGDLDDTERWRVGLTLTNAQIAHTWQGTTLHASPAAAQYIASDDVESECAEAEDPWAGADQADPSEFQPVTDFEVGLGEELDRDLGPIIASYPRRIGAVLVDWAILAVVTVPITLAWSSRTVTEISDDFAREVIRPTLGASLTAALIITAYEIVGIGAFGRTFGRWASGVIVVRLDGGAAGWGSSVVRYLVVSAGWIAAWVAPNSWAPITQWFGTVWMLIVYVPMLVDADRRGLHDRAAGTVVIRG